MRRGVRVAPSRKVPSQHTGATSLTNPSQSRSVPPLPPKVMSTRIALSRFAPALARAHKTSASAARRAFLVRGYASQSEHSVRACLRVSRT